ncbi:MAG TPA: hypothetical protein VL328_05465 [Gemmatimonadaceae bacterium]|jgi:hypothetical protein|nr:hypothetical protein [Gemmatimonadaceae bacterium]
MSPTVRVFVNGVGYDAPAGGTALDAVALHRADDAAAVRAGTLLVTDSRGLPIDALTPLVDGAVFRLVPNRARDLADPAAPFDE